MRIAYITNCFGTQSHTFIRREINALREQGVELKLFGIRQDYSNCAPDAKELVAETHYVYPIRLGRLLLATGKLFAQSPVRYMRGLKTAFTEDEFSLKRRLKMVYHFIVSATLLEDFKKQSITHVHAHFMNASASIAMYAAFHAKISYSITVHSAGTYKTDHILGVKQKLKNAQMLFMISAYNISYFNSIYPCQDKAHVVRCGMDLNEFQFHADDKPAIHSPLRLLGVGRFVEKKGFRYLIQACETLKKESLAFELTLVGDGPLLDQCKTITEQLGLTKNITFVGKRPTSYVRKTMQEADIVVVPSVTSASGEMEGLPVVIMEAMALGTPIVATAHSGIPEIVIPEETGALVPEKNSIELASAIQSVANRKDNAMLFTAKKLLDSEFNIETIAQLRKSLFLKAHKG